MTLATAIAAETGTSKEIYDILKARTVPVLGVLPGANLQAVLIGAGLMPYVHDTAGNQAFADPVFRGICIGMVQRFGPDGEIDFADAENVALIDVFVADAGVTAIVEAGPYVSTANLKAAILAKATTQQLEFPSLTLRQVIEINDPALAASEVSNAIAIHGISQQITLTTAADMPEPTTVEIQVSHNPESETPLWHPIAVDMPVIDKAGPYSLRALPGPLFKATSVIRAVSPYTVGITLE